MEEKVQFGLHVSVVSLISAASYLLTYWSLFSINPLEFIDVSDIVKLSVRPLIIVTLVAAGYIALYAWLLNRINNSRTHGLRIWIARKMPYLKWWPSVAAFIPIVLLIFGPSTPESKNGMILLSVFSLLSIGFVLIFLHRRDMDLTYAPPEARFPILIFFAVTPTLTAFLGALESLNVMLPNEPGYAVYSEGACNSTETQRYWYVGTLTGRLFSYSIENRSLCITPAEEFRLVWRSEKES